MKKITLFIFATSALLASCAREPIIEPVIDEGFIPLNIDGSISQVATKATAQGFVDRDAVGLFAVNYSDGNTVAGTLLASGNQADNVKYVFDEAAYKWTPVKPVYYKDADTNVDLYLYYPYQSDISDVNAFGFEVQKDQSSAATEVTLSGYEASDWLWGKVINVTPSESKVRIPLSHRLSAVQVTLVEGAGFDEDEFASIGKNVILTNTTRKATLDFSTGEASALGSPQADGIVMCPQEDGTFRAIVIPQSVAAGVQLFAITLDGISYSFKQNEPVSYSAGKQINVSIIVGKKNADGEYELLLGGISIIDWTEDRNTHGGEARQYYVVNVETPGTLGDIITAAGKSPAKIRNLKIVGQVNEEDFAFMKEQMSILEAVNMKESRVVGDIIPGGAFANKKTLVSFVFPEVITKICSYAFYNTTLSGPLILPNDVVIIESAAFSYSNISSVQFSNHLETIGGSAFMYCKALSGDLLFPNSVKHIEGYAFEECGGLNGRLELSDSLEDIGDYAFYKTGHFNGDLSIPEKVSKVGYWAFCDTRFSGSLYLNNVSTIGELAFRSCGFTGELVIPEGVIEIPQRSFGSNNFSSISFPSTLRTIGEYAFEYCYGIMEPLVFPDGFRTIQRGAFESCRNIPSLHFPSIMQTIQQNAFSGAYNISSIICDAIEPPSIQSNTFTGVAKDNFTVEVPAQSVTRYQTDNGWSDFRRISAHYDFSISRPRMRALNGSQSRTYVLRAPASFSWSVDSESLPDWITVNPMTGVGKTDVVISVSEMARTSDTFEVNEGTFNYPQYVSYQGRSGEVLFKLDEKNSSFTFTVEQFDYVFPDGYVRTLQTATKGPGIDFVITGDGYDAKDLSKGTFDGNAEAAYGHLFDIEPYKTYKDYFNVYYVIARSDDSGIGTVNTVKDSKFSTRLTPDGILCESVDDVFGWAKKANSSIDFKKSLVILLMNASVYNGTTLLYGDGSAVACCPVSTNAYPYDFRGLIQHEAGGHGFGKLGDEYILHNAYVTNCDQCLDHPQSDEDLGSDFGFYKSLGWYRNLSMVSDMRRVGWSHLIFHPQYSDYVDMYEGGYYNSRGMFRSEATSCMNNNIPYYSAISRQAIVERIKEYAGEPFDLEDFYAHDSNAVGTKAGVNYPADITYGVDPLFHRGSGMGPVYMGEHPNVK